MIRRKSKNIIKNVGSDSKKKLLCVLGWNEAYLRVRNSSERDSERRDISDKRNLKEFVMKRRPLLIEDTVELKEISRDWRPGKHKWYGFMTKEKSPKRRWMDQTLL